MNTVLEYARHYRELGFAVIPIQYGQKKPPFQFPLKYYLETPATEEELERLFRDGSWNIAVCLGDVSDGLTCRDFDEMGAYERWKADHPGLAAELPTVRTPRGMHVYFTSHGDEMDGRKIVPGKDGELKRGGYCLLPPSRHPCGDLYEWVNETLPGHVSDIRNAGFWPVEANGTQDIIPAQPQDHEVLEMLDVTSAIERSLPKGIGQRHWCLFQLARLLKATEYRDAPPEELKEVFNEWYRRALPFIRTKDWRTSWVDFLEGWGKVKALYGMLLQQIAAKAAGKGIDRLANFCRELQRRAGDKPFHLAGRAAAKALGLSHRTVARWLRKLVDEGVIIVTELHDRVKRRCREYRFRS